MKLAFILLIFAPISSAVAQQINNVHFEQNGKTIVVTYDLREIKKRQTAAISLYYSQDGGNTWSSRLHQVSGDVGKNIAAGTNKKITWNALLECAHLTGEVKFQVKADLEIEFKIGQKYGVGIIFYIDASGKHGLIASHKNLGEDVPWDCLGSTVSSTSSGIGTGIANTETIVS
jgi:hypothetical protein